MRLQQLTSCFTKTDLGGLEHLVTPAIIGNFRTCRFVAALACLAAIGSVWAQSAPESAQDALVILQKTSQQYVDLKTYKIVEEETFTSEHPPIQRRTQ